MTPERQKWWDSLPTEEKYIRKLIKHLEDDKKRRKAAGAVQAALPSHGINSAGGYVAQMASVGVEDR